MEKIAEILIEKLTQDEISVLCDSWDDGSLDDVVYTVLLPIDLKNHPEKYCEPNKDIAEG